MPSALRRWPIAGSNVMGVRGIVFARPSSGRRVVAFPVAVALLASGIVASGWSVPSRPRRIQGCCNRGAPDCAGLGVRGRGDLTARPRGHSLDHPWNARAPTPGKPPRPTASPGPQPGPTTAQPHHRWTRADVTQVIEPVQHRSPLPQKRGRRPTPRTSRADQSVPNRLVRVVSTIRLREARACWEPSRIHSAVTIVAADTVLRLCTRRIPGLSADRHRHV
jgi:hypothetical protein